MVLLTRQDKGKDNGDCNDVVVDAEHDDGDDDYGGDGDNDGRKS